MGVEPGALVDALPTTGTVSGVSRRPPGLPVVKNGEMKVQLLYFDGCPHWKVLEKRLGEALDLLHDRSTIEHLQVQSQREAERLGFAGSPSILLNGTDPFRPPTSAIGLTCRVYLTPDGPSGSPTVDQLVGALRPDIDG